MDPDGGGLPVMELSERLKGLQPGEDFSITINEEAKEAMDWVNFREMAMNKTLQSLREHRYGQYDKELVLKALEILEDLRMTRETLIGVIGREALGDSWRDILNKTGCEFLIDSNEPVIRFFKL